MPAAWKQILRQICFYIFPPLHSFLPPLPPVQYFQSLTGSLELEEDPMAGILLQRAYQQAFGAFAMSGKNECVEPIIREQISVYTAVLWQWQELQEGIFLTDCRGWLQSCTQVLDKVFSKE